MIQKVVVGIFLFSNIALAQTIKTAPDQTQSEYILLEIEPIEAEDSGATDAEKVKSRLIGGAGAAAMDGATVTKGKGGKGTELPKDPEPGECPECETCNPPCRKSGHFFALQYLLGAHLDFADLVGGYAGRYEFQSDRGALDATFGHMNGQGRWIAKLSGWVPVLKIKDKEKTSVHAILGGTVIDRNHSNMQIGGVGAGVAWTSKVADRNVRILFQPVAYYDENGLFEHCPGGFRRDARGYMTGFSVQGMLNGGEKNEDGQCKVQVQAAIQGGILTGMQAQKDPSDSDLGLVQEGVGAYMGAVVDVKSFLDRKRKFYIFGRIEVQNFFYAIDDVSLYPHQHLKNGKRDDDIETGLSQATVGFGFNLKNNRWYRRNRN